MLAVQCSKIIWLLLAHRACTAFALETRVTQEAKKSGATFLQRDSDDIILGESRQVVKTHIYTKNHENGIRAKAESREAVNTHIHTKRHENGIRMKAAQPQGVYSMHECQGENSVFMPPPFQSVHNTSCRFQNLCYDMASDVKRLKYFRDSKVGLDFNAFASLDLRPMADSGSNAAVPLPIDLVSGPIPEGASFWPVPVTVLFQPLGAENFGHQVGDNMFAVFAMQQLFHISDPYNSQLMMLDRCDRPEVDHQNRAGCVGMMNKLYNSISRHPVLQMRALDLMGAVARDKGKTNLMCFPTLIAGSGALSFRSPTVEGLSQTFYNYRSLLLRNALGPCTTGTCDAIPAGRKTIVISRKTAFHPRGMGPGMGNEEEIQQHLSRVFPDCDVLIRDFASLSFEDQLALVSKAAVMFSHSGGGSFSGLFLPHGATLTIVAQQGWERSPFFMNLEMRFWRSLSWLTLQERRGDLSPVAAEQIVRTARLRW